MGRISFRTVEGCGIASAFTPVLHVAQHGLLVAQGVKKISNDLPWFVQFFVYCPASLQLAFVRFVDFILKG